MVPTADTSLDRAARLASPFFCHPNPRVGAVLVGHEAAVIGEGAHQGPGTPHAERVALEEAGVGASGATLYTTLEPCDHHGRTPPCTDAIIDAAVARVVIGALDPDAKVAGAGVAKLESAGIQVEVVGGYEWVDPAYFHHRRTGRPHVVLKAAMTLDGQIGAVDGTSQWITGTEAREDAHRLRAESDAVMVGAGTVRNDDPRLDVRLDSWHGHQPRPIVVVGSQPLPPSAAVLERDPLIVAPDSTYPGATITASGVETDRVDLHGALKQVGEMGILSLLVEGGPTLAASMLDAALVDTMVVYIGAKLAGGAGKSLFAGDFPTIGSAQSLRVTSVKTVGPDVRIDAALES